MSTITFDNGEKIIRFTCARCGKRNVIGPKPINCGCPVRTSAYPMSLTIGGIRVETNREVQE